MERFVIVFIDDILVYSKNHEEHVKHLAELLILLREHRLYAKHGKCSFFQTKIHYLRHVVSKEGITMDPEKIRTIMEWIAPRNVDEVISFMGLTDYYRRFIRNFSHISYHITSFERKGKKFEWKEECTTSFEKCSSFKGCRSRQRVFGMYICFQDRTWWSPYLGRTCSML